MPVNQTLVIGPITAWLEWPAHPCEWCARGTLCAARRVLWQPTLPPRGSRL